MNEKFTKRASHLRPRVIYCVYSSLTINFYAAMELARFWSLKAARDYLRLMEASYKPGETHPYLCINDKYVVELKGIIYYLGFDSDAEGRASDVYHSAHSALRKRSEYARLKVWIGRGKKISAT